MNMRPSFTDAKTTLRADFDAIRISLHRRKRSSSGRLAR